MRGDQLARQWRMLRTIQSKKQGTTVAELAVQEHSFPRTIWLDLSAIQEAGLALWPWNKSLSNSHKRRCHSCVFHSTYQAGRLIVPLVLYSEKDGQKSRWGFVEGCKFQLPVQFTVIEVMSLHSYRAILRTFEDNVFYESLHEFFRFSKLLSKFNGFLVHISGIIFLSQIVRSPGPCFLLLAITASRFR
jgi:hypothetical protein